MANQFLRPTADVTITGWVASTSTDLFAMLDDTSTDATADGDYIRASLSSSVYTWIGQLTTATDPTTEGAQTIQLRAMSSTASCTITGSIWNATTQLFEFLSTAAITPAGAFKDFTYNLTTANIASLAGNYDALRVRLVCPASTNDTVDVSLFVWELPSPPVVFTLTVDGATHAQTVDGTVLNPRYNLVVGATTHAQTADGAVLAPAYNLLVDATTHAQSVDNASLTYNPPGGNVELAVDATTHAHTADGVVLSPAYNLTVDASTLAHTADGVVLAPAYSLKVQDATHAQSAENDVLNPRYNLTVADATMAQSADNADLTYNATPPAPVVQAAQTHGGKRYRWTGLEDYRRKQMEEEELISLFLAVVK